MTKVAANLGDTWNDIAFNDSAWPSGKGVFAWETDNNIVLPLTNTVLALSNAVGAPIITYYFRTHVNIAEPTFITITASNLVDDGAVIYVNNQEVRRQNLPPLPNVIRYDTTANSVIEAAWTGYSIPSSFFVPGDNVIAAEVHNVSPTSSATPDIVFGMRLIGTEITPSPIIIRDNPTDLTVTEGPPPALPSVSPAARPRFNGTIGRTIFRTPFRAGLGRLSPSAMPISTTRDSIQSWSQIP